jgi:hypothetical protein
LNPLDNLNPRELLHVIAVSTTLDNILVLFSAILRYGGEPDYRRINVPEEFAAVVRERAGDVIVGLWPDLRFAALAATAVAREAHPGIRMFTFKTFGGVTMVVVVRNSSPEIGTECDRFTAALDRLLAEIREQATLPGADGLPITRIMTAPQPAPEPYIQRREMVAHDLSNLVTVILGCGEVLAEQLRGNNSGAMYVEDLMTAARRVARLIAELKASGEPHDPAPVDAALVLAVARGRLQTMAADWLTITLQMSTVPMVVAMDPRRLEKLAAEIVVHARLAMRRGSSLDIAVGQITVPAGPALPDLTPGSYAAITFSYGTKGSAGSARKELPPVLVSKETALEMGFANLWVTLEQSGGGLAISQKSGRIAAVTIVLPLAEAEDPPGRT